MPAFKFTFILASYAFQNLNDKDLEQCVEKCVDSLLTGGVLLMREPFPEDDKTPDFDENLQRIIRPKQVYIELFERHRCKQVFSKNHKYQKNYAPEFAIAFQRTML